VRPNGHRRCRACDRDGAARRDDPPRIRCGKPTKSGKPCPVWSIPGTNGCRHHQH
jgi:hypothetical protein